MPTATAVFRVADVAAGRAALRALGPGLTVRRPASPPCRCVYYDTFDWRLYRAGTVLMLREENGASEVRWLETDGGVRCRLPLESVPGFHWQFPAGRCRDALAPVLGVRRLMPRARTETIAEEVAVGSGVRVRLESGHSSAGDQGPVRPLPVLLRVLADNEREAAAREVLASLEGELGLERQRAQDLETALAALGRRPDDYRPKPRVAIDPGDPAAEAVRRVLGQLLRVARRNEDGARLGLDSEFLHDLRVAVRRTRTLLAELGATLASSEVGTLRGELAWLGRETGPARDLDVHGLVLAEQQAPLPEEDRTALAPLAGRLEAARAAEQRRVERALAGPRYGRLVALWEALSDPADPSARPDPPIVVPVSGRIWKSYRRVLRRGRRLDADPEPDRLHRLRIACKKLRYLLELFRSLYPADRVRPLLRALRRLQDDLGEFNDLEIQGCAYDRLADEAEADGGGGDTLRPAVRRLAARLEERSAELRRRSLARFARFADAGLAADLRGLVRPAKKAAGRAPGSEEKRRSG